MAHFRIWQSAWNDIDDATILDLYSKDWGGLGRSVAPGSPLATSLSSYLEALRDWAANPPPDQMQSVQGTRGLLDKVNPNGVDSIIFGQNMGVSAALPRIGGGTVIP